MQYIIPFISGILFHFGGRDQFEWLEWFNQKLWRWLMGVPIALMYAIMLRSWIPLLCSLTYFLATNASSYGENHPFRKWFGRDGAWIVYGFLFGLASLPILGVFAIGQAVIASASFWGLMKWSNDGFNGHKLNHKIVELSFGFIGTILYFFKGV